LIQQLKKQGNLSPTALLRLMLLTNCFGVNRPGANQGCPSSITGECRQYSPQNLRSTLPPKQTPYAYCDVADRGPGIDDFEQSLIFDKFTG